MIAHQTATAALVALGALAASAAVSTPAGAARLDAEKVEVEVYADVAAIAPGCTFHLAVEYTIEPDWHIYWINPGDTGFATTLEIEAPEHFVVGPVQYPGPHRFEQPGELVSFGYDKQATLVVEIKAPQTLSPGEEIDFQVRTDWLACKEACVTGSAEKSITLKSKVTIEEPEPATAARFDKARARLPRELKELKAGTVRWQGGTSSPQFEATFPSDLEIEIFPLLIQDVTAGKPTVTRLDDGSSHVSVTFDVKESRQWPDGPRSLAVLRIKSGEEESYYDLAAPAE